MRIDWDLTDLMSLDTRIKHALGMKLFVGVFAFRFLNSFDSL